MGQDWTMQLHIFKLFIYNNYRYIYFSVKKVFFLQVISNLSPIFLPKQLLASKSHLGKTMQRKQTPIDLCLTENKTWEHSQS